MKLLTKLLLFILSVSAFVYAVSIGYISINAQRQSANDAKQLADAYAMRYANLAASNLNIDIGVTRSLAHSLLGFRKIQQPQRTEIYNDMLRNILIENPSYLSVWTSWELNAIDSGYTKTHGRIRTTYYYVGDEIRFYSDSVDLEKDNIESIYYKIKTSKDETVTNPYWYTYSERRNERAILETSVAVPIVKDDKFVGLAGLDIPLDKYQNIIKNIRPFEIGYAYLIANNGSFVGHPNPDMLGENLAETDSALNAEEKIIEKIRRGENFNTEIVDVENEIHNYVSYASVHIGKTKTPWSIAVVVPIDKIMEKANRNFYISIVIAGISLLVLTIILWLFSRSVTKPLETITRTVIHLSKGNISKAEKVEVKTSDEIGKIAGSVNKLIEGLRSTVRFASQIGEGNLEASFTLLSDKDALGNALLEMRKSLKQAQLEEDLRKQENEKRNWTVQGLAKFEEMLRNTENNIESFAYNIIKNLVEYNQAVVGAFYIINDEDKKDTYIELTASFSYSKTQKSNKRIEIGEGIIGRAVKEKETVLMTNIPANFFKINSGLGQSKPKNLAVVPLLYTEEVFGAVEIASFKTIEPHQIKFIEKVGESIASTISSVKINMITSQLLEESRKASEDFAIQEIEMRQTNRELEKAIETLQKNQSDLEKEVENLNAKNKELLHQKEQMEKARAEEAQKAKKEIAEMGKKINNEIIEIRQKEKRYKKQIADKEVLISKLKEKLQNK